MAEIIEQIKYRGFTITIKAYPSRFGTGYRATNDYGEPSVFEQFSRTAKQAVEAEKKFLDECIEQ